MQCKNPKDFMRITVPTSCQNVNNGQDIKDQGRRERARAP